MLMKSFAIAFIGFVIVTASAWAGNSGLQGIVKDPKGQPIKGADIRIEAQGGGKLFGTAKTDATGRYTSGALPAGTYRVTLIVNGVVKSSINNTKTKVEGPTELNFDLKPASASQASAPAKKAKHYVWVPPKTGTHLGGGWVEVDDNDNASGTAAHNANRVDTTTGKALQTLGPGGGLSR
jgi:carboxypeptidase family protein